MTIPRIFVSSQLSVKQKFALDAAASRHILQVLRLQINDPVLIFNNNKGEFKSRLIGVNKKQAVVFLEEFIIRNNESPLSIHLGQGISRGEKMDFTIQKAVELGISTITPIFTAFCNVKLNDNRLEKRLHHWQKVAISASEQSGRCYIPQIFPSQTLTKWCKTQSGLCLVLDPAATTKLSSITAKPNKITILVGPEGGLSDEEIAEAKQSQFMPITLGPRILRTETAALTAISILQAKWGDL